MAGRKRPTQPDARERLQAAQEREAAALVAVELAAGKVERTKDRLDSALTALQRRVQEAENGLTCARARLADVSGVERAAVLLDDSPVKVRADVRDARRLDRKEGQPSVLAAGSVHLPS